MGDQGSPQGVSHLVSRVCVRGGLFGPDSTCARSMFTPEDVWTSRLNLTQNITITGASPLFPNVTCNEAYEICHVCL